MSKYLPLPEDHLPRAILHQRRPRRQLDQVRRGALGEEAAVLEGLDAGAQGRLPGELLVHRGTQEGIARVAVVRLGLPRRFGLRRLVRGDDGAVGAKLQLGAVGGAAAAAAAPGLPPVGCERRGAAMPARGGGAVAVWQGRGGAEEGHRWLPEKRS